MSENSVIPTIRSVVAVCLLTGSTTFAGFESFTTPSVAVQEVNLLGFAGQLTAVGEVTWNLDVDANGNSINGDSSITSLFQGILPGTFGPLAGAPFLLFSTSPGQTVDVTNNGTTVTVNTAFGLDIFGPGPTELAEFFTATPSAFVTSVSGIPFTSFFATSPDQATIFLGPNLIFDPNQLPVGAPVGVSFDRTVSSVPEPSTFALAGLGGIGLLAAAFRRRHQQCNMN